MPVLKVFCTPIIPCLVFIFAKYIPTGQSLIHPDGPCIPQNCECIFPNGKFIDLLHHNPQSSFKVNESWNILFHPCQDMKIGNSSTNNECFFGASICLQNIYGNQSYILGNSSSRTFTSINSELQPITVKHIQGIRTTSLLLKCAPEVTSDLFNVTSSQDNTYVITWTSSSNATCPTLHADMSSLSTGSILVIMLMVFAIVYLGGGMLTLKYLRGAEGKEMIPNYDFWVDLPYLVRDGILYALGGFKTPTSYDRI